GREHRAGRPDGPLRCVLCRRSDQGPAGADAVLAAGQGDVLRDQSAAGETRPFPDGKDRTRAATPAGPDLGSGSCQGGSRDAPVRRPAVIRAVVAGAAGRMGSRVLALLREEKDFAVTGAFERSGTEFVGRNAGGIRI